TDHGTNLDGKMSTVGELQHVVKESVGLVPQSHSIGAEMVHGVGNVDEVLPEFAGDVFVGGILRGELHGDGQQVQRVHGHPAGAVGLLDVAAGGKRVTAVEDSDVVEAEKAALENVHTFSVFAVDPPGEIQKKFMEDADQKCAVTAAVALFVDLVHAPRG